jgi:hypothetical protein
MPPGADGNEGSTDLLPVHLPYCGLLIEQRRGDILSCLEIKPLNSATGSPQRHLHRPAT